MASELETLLRLSVELAQIRRAIELALPQYLERAEKEV